MPDIFHAHPSSTPTPIISQPNPVDEQPPSTPPPAEVQAPVQQSAPLEVVNSKPDSYSFLKAMLQNPQGISFSSQEADEQVKLVLHASVLTVLPWISFTTILVIVPITLAVFFPTINLDLSTFVQPQLLAIIAIAYYLLVFGYAYLNYIIWFYNVSIISTKHVLDIEFSNISYKAVDIVTISEIADVSYNQSGFTQTFFNFGTVRVDPEAQDKSIYLEHVPHPSFVTDYILSLKEGKIT